MNLNRTDDQLDRMARNKENENWDIIESEINEPIDGDRIEDGAVSTDKLNKNVMVRTPWLSNESDDLDYIWEEGNYIVAGVVKNNPFNFTSFCNVKRGKTTDYNHPSLWVHQTITSIGDPIETKERIINISEPTRTINYIRKWEPLTSKDIENNSIGLEKLKEKAIDTLFDIYKEKLGFRIANMNWAQLERNFSFTRGKFVFYTQTEGIHYRDNANMMYSESIAVSEGDVWRISTRSISNWSANARGVFIDHNGQFAGFIPTDGNDPNSGISTFIIPKGVSTMIVNARIHNSNQTQTHILKLHDWQNIWDPSSIGYTLNQLIENDGTVTATEQKMGVTNAISVVPGEIYRIANVHSGGGQTFTMRGVFLDGSDQVVAPIPDNAGGSIPYQWNDVMVPPRATKMRINFYYEIQTRTDTLKSITINKAIPAAIEYSADFSKLVGKKVAFYGDSTTWYSGWVRLVENATGISPFINGYSSATITTKRADNTLCDDSRIDALMSSDPDVVTILGGLNDGAGVELGSENDFRVEIGEEDKSTFYGAYAYIVKRILSIKPTVKIIIMTTTYNNYNYTNDNYEPNTSLDYARASKKIAEYFGIQVADIRHTTQMNKYTNDVMLSDNIHFSMRGEEAIAGTLLRELKNINWFSK